MDADLGVPLLEVLFGANSAKFLDNTQYVQPALFAIEYGLADLLHHWGIDPDYVIGHSVGEIVAASVAGVINLEGAVRFVIARGRLMGQLPRGGKMLAIDATAEQAREWLAGKEADASIAGINGRKAWSYPAALRLSTKLQISPARPAGAARNSKYRTRSIHL